MKEWDYVIETRITTDEAGNVIFWLKDKSLEEIRQPPTERFKCFNIQSSMLRGEKIVDDLEAALKQFREIAIDLAATCLR